MSSSTDLDASDPLARFREEFVHNINEPGLIYLDGNSLGRLPKRSALAAADLINGQWGNRLIRSWNEGWFEIPNRVGDLIGELLGAHVGEVVLADNTSVCLFKAAVAALKAQPGRTQILTDDMNFPSDIQILRSAAEYMGPEYTVEIIRTDGTYGSLESVRNNLGDQTALLSLSQVAYKSGWLWDLSEVCKLAKNCGVLSLWDLSHSVGAVPIDLAAAEADLAVGCSYKYLNGGPGAPAFIYVSQKSNLFSNPIAGWYGTENPFQFDFDARPAAGAGGFITGTPPILSSALVASGVQITLEAGIDRIRAKSVALTQRFIELVNEHLVSYGFQVASPVDATNRGSHVSLFHPEAQAVGQALIHEESVIPDFRPPDLLRFGFTPLYTRYADVDETIERLQRVCDSGAIKRWRDVNPLIP
ncbi:MAG: kynureninase [Actinomycetota bacterium]|nr:kynureninase [Actinomycetota bacterium]MDG2120782.1 kynureninase [Actinomycetota bacterium]